MKSKLSLLVILLSAVFCNVHAQVSKGSIFLGGNINFMSQKINSLIPNVTSTSNSVFNFSPAMGKAIKDNMVVGIDLDYAYSKVDQGTGSYVQTNNGFGAGVFLRRYVALGKGFYVFGQGRFGAMYNSGKIDQGQPTATSDNIKGFSFNFGFYPGISYQVSKRLQLETGFNNLAYISFQHNKDTQTAVGGPVTEAKTNSFSIGTSLDNLAAFTLGFRVLLSK